MIRYNIINALEGYPLKLKIESIKDMNFDPEISTINPHQKTFDALVKKLSDKDVKLGACFERNVSFESFEDNKLTWTSKAEGEDVKILSAHWALINMFVKDIFGFETIITEDLIDPCDDIPF